tara:strand:- start:30 stop:185 length:156 start_codon:yes stop_codon:yes gene_type:complete
MPENIYNINEILEAVNELNNSKRNEKIFLKKNDIPLDTRNIIEDAEKYITN